MKFRKKRTSNWYLMDTKVENLFIGEYMAAAPGKYLKVYILGLMYADIGEETDAKAMAKQLMIETADVHDAWIYWESLGLVKKKQCPGDYEIEFISPRDNLYGREESVQTAQEGEDIFYEGRDEIIADMFAAITRTLGRPLGGTEPEEICQWIDIYGVTPEMAVYAYEYCIKNRKRDNVKYIAKVVKAWVEEGLKTTDEIKAFLEENDKKYFIKKRIFKALGFTRNPTEAEDAIMDKWLDKEGFLLDEILDACGKTSGINSPNINYVDKVLTSRRKDSGSSNETQSSGRSKPIRISDYYDYLQEKSRKEAAERQREIYQKVPEIRQIDEDIREKGMEAVKFQLSGQQEKAAEAKRIAEDLMAEKAAIMTENEFSPDYMDEKHLCDICNDTGMTDAGERCSCYEQRLLEAEEWQNS